MSKILINQTPDDIHIDDTGVTVAANDQYTIPSQDYATFAASSDVIRYLADLSLVLNDGSSNILKLSNAVDIIKGWFPQEVDDALIGSTKQYSGTLDPGVTLVPDVAGEIIKTVLIRCPTQTPQSNRLLYSIDGGSIYHTLSPGEFIGWSLRGAQTQIQLQPNQAGVAYEVTVNTVDT